MEQLIKLHIEKLPEGVYLATSDDIQGLVAQGDTIAETLEIATDVANQLIEARTERENMMSLISGESLNNGKISRFSL
ncbi:type II toxin-antitoxin system HicB family antitoxin [Candidatus Marithrix sp. Canyon 246]|uniref:type II toxin-antitoxin system HicB family antitoxin n=1 Tax=Candidatus Marithrix sp. Canyon 246 TaxID=1827136 RepID=UPI00084A0C69|nr:type II toxin-antitoxin system HicB family antitoxin [Candidatus Marithrix sp. Canyon 246]